jgi:hypothetical protein
MSSDPSRLINQHLHLNHRLRTRVFSNDCSIESVCPSFSSSSQTESNTSDDRSSNHAAAAEDLSLSSSEDNDPAYSVINSSATQSITRPSGNRRRSHRPRGCRGGRKNRKKQLAKELALSVPKEILGTKAVVNQQPSKASAMTFNNTGMFMANLKDMQVVNQHVFRSSFPDENKAGWHLTSIVGSSALNGKSGDGIALGIYNAQLNGSRECTFQAQDQVCNRLPSSSMIYVASSAPPKLAVVGIQDILPPPPIVARESPAPFDGPNPYALTTCSLSIDTSFRKTASSAVPSHSKNHDAFATPHLPMGIAMTAARNTTQNGVPLTRLGTAGSDSGISSDGTEETYESSSSLFATSPRTFLMGGGGGCKGSEHLAMQW